MATEHKIKENPAFAILSQEYNTLREEIIQSIRYQHQILLTGYGAAGAVVSYGVANKLPGAFAIIPFILIGMASLWIVECNRMVRASFYIGTELWPCIKNQVKPDPECQHWPNINWEKWIRHNVTPEALSFQNLQDRWQRVVVITGPAFASLIALIIANHSQNPDLEKLFIKPPLPLVSLILALLWCRVFWDFRKISRLDAIAFPPGASH